MIYFSEFFVLVSITASRGHFRGWWPSEKLVSTSVWTWTCLSESIAKEFQHLLDVNDFPNIFDLGAWLQCFICYPEKMIILHHAFLRQKFPISGRELILKNIYLKFLLLLRKNATSFIWELSLLTCNFFYLTWKVG